jgi:hypothetical protein
MTLNFSDSTVFVGNSTDTIFTLNYAISNDSLITWLRDGPKMKHKVLFLTRDSLALEGIHNEQGTLKYSSTQKPY